jgi:hypothetical protein
MTMTRTGALILSLLAATGCASENNTVCTRDTDCPAGHACADGRCLPRFDTGQVQLDMAPPDAGVDQHYVYPDGTGPDGGCVPNLDDKVQFHEMTIAAIGTDAKVIKSEDVEIDLAGTDVGGTIQWDLTKVPGNPGTISVEPVPAWAAKDFPADAYASELMSGYGLFFKADLLGVFQKKQSALQLIGLVSKKKSHTNVRYDTALHMPRFPTGLGDQYTTKNVGKGYSTGYTEYNLPWVYDESYTIDVLTKGKLKLLEGLTLDALLMRVTHEVSYGAPLATNVAFMLVAECYGTLARIIAEKDPKDDLKAVKVERMWRLAAP